MEILFLLLAGAAVLLALTMHGALWVAMKSPSPVRERAARLAHGLWWAVAAASVATVSARIATAHLGPVFPVIALAGLLGINICKAPQAEALAYLSSCALLTGMLLLVV